MSKKKVKDELPKMQEAIPPTKEGLPQEAFAIVGNPQDASTWKLPHHTRAIFRSLAGKLDVQSTVHWPVMPAIVAFLSPVGYEGVCVKASPEERLAAAHHLAAHYQAANKSLPNALAVLV